jgi:hypothetical protein
MNKNKNQRNWFHEGGSTVGGGQHSKWRALNARGGETVMGYDNANAQIQL